MSSNISSISFPQIRISKLSKMKLHISKLDVDVQFMGWLCMSRGTSKRLNRWGSKHVGQWWMFNLVNPKKSLKLPPNSTFLFLFKFLCPVVLFFNPSFVLNDGYDTLTFFQTVWWMAFSLIIVKLIVNFTCKTLWGKIWQYLLYTSVIPPNT